LLTGKNTGNFVNSDPQIGASLPVSSTFYWEKMGIHPKSEQGNNRGVSGIRDCLLRSWNREFT
jgi:hypothetical protein